MGWRDNLQELRELGALGTLHRGWWELKLRSGAARVAPVATPPASFDHLALERIPWAAAGEVRARIDARLDDRAKGRVIELASRATYGKIQCFGRWEGDYGDPIDWHRNPVTGERWDPSAHWSLAMRDGHRVGDVKLTWEAGRFPQAFHLARAAVLSPGDAPVFARAFVAMVRGFLDANPFPLGVHWSSNQECALRLNAWLFALKVFGDLGVERASLEALARDVVAYAWRVGSHTEREIQYARRAVYNNHLITEAFGLFLAAWLNPSAPEAVAWRASGLDLLTEQADAQVYPDGAYINLAHNYHRVILQEYLLAARVLGVMPEGWRAAIDRSIDFLDAHMNPADGRLPNYGANDGSLPRVLSACDFSDFRPTLQCAAVAARGERLYPEGPWDEEALWMFGARVDDCPVRPRVRRTVSFARTGFHVMRSSVEGSFGAWRCGTIRDRFGQIDMLHLDVFFRGHNVLVDGGTYLYNAEEKWHDHFLRTSSHNTVTVDGRDQMLHHRRFKYLYWTEADVLRWEPGEGSDLAVGEHRGYARHPGGCVHRRAVLRVGEHWVVVDRVTGDGEHRARIQWLGGEFAHTASDDGARMTLTTPDGDFEVAVFGDGLRADVVRGCEDPPRGFVSRYYGQRSAVPSLAAEATFRGAVELVSVLGPGPLSVLRSGGRYEVAGVGAFTVRDGIPVMA